MESLKPQRVGDYGRELQAVGGRISEAAVLGGQFGDLPLPGLCTARPYFKFLAQVTEPQVFVNAS